MVKAAVYLMPYYLLSSYWIHLKDQKTGCGRQFFIQSQTGNKL